MSSLIVKNALIVTQDKDRRIIKGDILVEDNLIVQVGKVTGDADEVIEAGGDIVMPGMVNTHSHIAMSVMKGVADDVPFGKFLDKVFAIDSDRQEKDLLAGAKLGAMEMLLSGTTTFVDMYYSEDIIAKAVQQAGLRGVLCWAVLDVQFTTQKGVPLDNCKRFFAEHKDQERIYPGIGLQGVYVCSTETFQASEEFSRSSGALMHFHLSETRKEVYDHKDKTGKRPADYLESIGVLSDRCLAAHSAWLTINEVKALGRNGCSIATCPVSNMKLATGGVAPIPEMMMNGVNVSVGTDGSTTNNSLDMFGEMKMLALLQKSYRWDPTILPAQQVLDLVTLNGAKAVHLEMEIGSIEVGKKADMVILDGKAPNLRPLLPDNVVSNIVYCGNAGNVKTVLCDGKAVVRDRHVRTMDQKKVLEESEPALISLRKGH
ncbi:MAG: metal-dependent hydrolase [Methanomassiliicoccales archaeon PtaU1.Bin124]|nr:MAG: metal-dependent hydrolase [Methanomassiliicoccales archaeon PtaU1.Bin124]